MDAHIPAEEITPQWIRVVSAGVAGLRRPFLELTGPAPGPERDLPALSAACLALPVLVAATTRGFVGTIAAGPTQGLVIAAVGVLFTAVLATTAIAALWAFEAILARFPAVEHGHVERAWSFSAVALCLFGLPFGWMYDLGSFLLLVMIFVIGFRAFGKLKSPPPGQAVLYQFVPPIAGIIAVQGSLWLLVASGAFPGLGRLVAAALETAPG